MLYDVLVLVPGDPRGSDRERRMKERTDTVTGSCRYALERAETLVDRNEPAIVKDMYGRRVKQ